RPCLASVPVFPWLLPPVITAGTSNSGPNSSGGVGAAGLTLKVTVPNSGRPRKPVIVEATCDPNRDCEPTLTLPPLGKLKVPPLVQTLPPSRRLSCGRLML